MQNDVHRRHFLRGAGLIGGGLAASTLFPGWAQSATPGLSTLPTLSGEEIKLTVGHSALRVDGRAPAMP